MWGNEDKKEWRTYESLNAREGLGLQQVEKIRGSDTFMFDKTLRKKSHDTQGEIKICMEHREI